MLRKSLNAAAAAAIALSLTACGGGGGSTSALPTTVNPTNTTPSAKSAQASMTIKIPARAATSSVKAQYISASTQSMTIGTVSGGKTTQVAEVDLTSSSKSCSAIAGGGLQCNVTFVGQAGPNVYALSMYDKTGGSGNMLSTGQVSANLVAGQNTTIAVALDGVPVGVTAALGASSLPVGQAGSTNVIVEARDSDNNVIVGPGGFTTPVTLTISGDAHNTLSFATTASGSTTGQTGTTASVNSPGQLVTLNYNGGSNVGSTITPSIGSKSGIAATFSGSGGTMQTFTFNDVADNLSWFYGYGAAAFDDGTAALLLEGSTYAIAVANPSGVTKAYTGDTTDPYNVPAAGSLSYSGMTVVNGMMQNLQREYGDQYSEIAANSSTTANANKVVYYSASFSSSSAPSTVCSGTMNGGVLGALNTVAGTVKNYVTKGVPMYIQVDSSGNVWFVEVSGYCSATGSYFASGYAIGELPAGASQVTETDFNAAGVTGTYSVYPASMSITADGKSMFIGDSSNQLIFKIATASLTGASSVSITNSKWPYALATAPDGTTAWWSDNDGSSYDYYYGIVDSGFTKVTEQLFPMNDFYSDGMTYADGSFWVAGNEYQSGFGRVSGWSNGTPVTNYYATPYPDGDGQELTGISAAGGYVWATDYEYANIDVLQYGAPGTGTVSFARHGAAMNMAPRNPAALHHTPHGPHHP